MIKVNAINDLLKQEVSRKEFLKYMGAGVLALIGITTLLNNLSALNSSQSGKKANVGYGSNYYGR